MSNQVLEKLKNTKKASRMLVSVSKDQINKVLTDLADNIIKNKDNILFENRKDLEKMDRLDPKYDRLELTEKRLEEIANSIRDVVKLEYPIGEILEEKFVKNGKVIGGEGILKQVQDDLWSVYQDDNKEEVAKERFEKDPSDKPQDDNVVLSSIKGCHSEQSEESVADGAAAVTVDSDPQSHRIDGILKQVQDDNKEEVAKERFEKDPSGKPQDDNVVLNSIKGCHSEQSEESMKGEKDPQDDKEERLKQVQDGITTDQRDSSTSVGMTDALYLQKVRVPLGVVGVIYEARPNVTPDVFTLCLKSGNACVLKGGSDAHNSNTVFVSIIKEVLKKNDLSQDLVCLLPPDREAVDVLLKANGFVDVLIPRGGQGLIEFVRKNAQIPVIETGAGVCHTYFDEFGNLDYGKKIVKNAKTRRPSVCNALDCLIVNKKRLGDLFDLVIGLEEFDVEILADEQAFAALEDKYSSDLLMKAGGDSFGKEFLSLRMSIKTVDSLEEAIDHITEYSSMHSESIVSDDKENQEKFLKIVDAAAVYVNTSTAFTDGGQFGLGAEIGISTQKLHARGPMGLKELTSYKWLIKSEGVVR